MLLATILLAGCSKEEDNSTITVANSETLTQEVFADDTTLQKGVSITTAGPWTSSISTSDSQTKAAGNTWAGISPDHGDAAGTYTIAVTLQPNMTGADRTATIRIRCNGDEIIITVRQKGTKEDGKTPVAVTDLTLEISEQLLYVGDHFNLFYNVEPADVNDNDLVWSSSNTAVATVSAASESSEKDGKWRTITAITTGEAVITVATPDGSKSASCKITVVPQMTLTELAVQCEDLLDAAASEYEQIDDLYSTYTARLSLTQATPALWSFWQKAYEVINACNLLLARVTGDEYDSLSDAVKKHVGTAHAARGTAYFYLKTLFGGVPVVEKSSTSIPRSTAQEIVDLIYYDMETAYQINADINFYFFGLARGIIYLQEGDVQQAIQVLSEKIDSGKYAIRDTNEDGLINGNDNNDGVVHIYLLLAEAYNKSGDTMKAAQYLNIVNVAYGKDPAYGQGSVPSSSDILEGIRQQHSALTNTSMKFLNAVRWGETSSWGYRELLPIPQAALNSNPALTQNPGW